MDKNEGIERLMGELAIRNFSGKTVKSYAYFVERFLNFAGNNELNEDLVKNYIQIAIKNQESS